MREYHDELEADFQEYYRLNLEKMGEDFSVKHAGVCASQLPPQSRTYTAMDYGAVWHWEEHLLAEIADSLHCILYYIGGLKNKPKPIQRPRSVVKDTQTMPVDEYKRRLKMPRREVEHGD